MAFRKYIAGALERATSISPDTKELYVNQLERLRAMAKAPDVRGLGFLDDPNKISKLQQDYTPAMWALVLSAVSTALRTTGGASQALIGAYQKMLREARVARDKARGIGYKSVSYERLVELEQKLSRQVRDAIAGEKEGRKKLIQQHLILSFCVRLRPMTLAIGDCKILERGEDVPYGVASLELRDHRAILRLPEREPVDLPTALRHDIKRSLKRSAYPRSYLFSLQKKDVAIGTSGLAKLLQGISPGDTIGVDSVERAYRAYKGSNK